MPFIYTLVDPTTNEIRYVGKANDPERRLSNHVYQHGDTSNPHKHNWIKKLVRQGLKPIMHVIEICADSEWKQREKYWIAKYRKSNTKLLNISIGGDDFGFMSPEGRKRQHDAYMIWFAQKRGLKLYRCYSCGSQTVSRAKLCKKCAIRLSDAGYAEAIKFYLYSYRDEQRKNKIEDSHTFDEADMDVYEGPYIYHPRKDDIY